MESIELTPKQKDSIVKRLLKAHRRKVYNPTIGRFVKDNKALFMDQLGYRLTRKVILDEYQHLFKLGDNFRIIEIY